MGLEPTVFQLKLLTSCQDLLKLRFFMSQHRKISARSKVIGKQWIYLEKYTSHKQNVVCLKRQVQTWEEQPPKTECVSTHKMRGPEI